jgi:DNA topoisomerase I
MSKSILIVESPAKAKTIKKYLGADFEVLASYGHVRDLIPKSGAVDPEHDFAMRYVQIEKNAKHVHEIIHSLRDADSIYLATDPDREGEAIAWHIHELLKAKKVLKKKPVHRVVFYEITRAAVNNAMQHPRTIAMDLVYAQQARRALDYLVGFTLSPLLWKKVRRGLSAGRVQSPALRLITEREQEIEAFQTQEYWTITAQLLAKDQQFSARLIVYENEKCHQFSFQNQAQADAVKKNLLQQAQGRVKVISIDKKRRKRNPSAPFTTSTLQQEAANKLGFTAQRTMRIAQQLYEGIDVGQGLSGLITYMRTDSVNLANEAIESIRAWVKQTYGENALPEAPRQFRTKSRTAQEAHEAIRPTNVAWIPEQIKNYLTLDQFKLYDLIWKRSVACQMIHALIDLVAIDFSCGKDAVFRSNGSTVADPGFMVIYRDEQHEEKDGSSGDATVVLPQLQLEEWVELKEIQDEQHFTEPPPRYSEASLIKTLEEHGIGRPSTYVPIIATLQQRQYVTLEQKRFKPTDIGRVVNKFLTQYFTQYVDYDFTARLEDELDDISLGQKKWKPLLKQFWTHFKSLVDTIEKTVQRKEVTQQQIDELCPKCGKSLAIRLGKRGRFIGCSNFPECDYTRDLNEENNQSPEIIERTCPQCQHALQIRTGRYGKFIGCSHYPNCKYIEPLEKPFDTKITCPICNEGTLCKRKSRFNKFFYSCSRYPQCKYAVWNEPIAKSCPRCAWPIMTIKTTKRRGTEYVCPRKECNYVQEKVK